MNYHTALENIRKAGGLTERTPAEMYMKEGYYLYGGRGAVAYHDGLTYLLDTAGEDYVTASLNVIDTDSGELLEAWTVTVAPGGELNFQPL